MKSSVKLEARESMNGWKKVKLFSVLITFAITWPKEVRKRKQKTQFLSQESSSKECFVATIHKTTSYVSHF